MSEAETKPPRLLRRPEVLVRTGLSVTSMHELIKRKEFPSPRRLLTRGVAWLESDIDAWIDSLQPVAAKELKA